MASFGASSLLLGAGDDDMLAEIHGYINALNAYMSVIVKNK